MAEAQAKLEKRQRELARYSQEVREDVALDRAHFAEKQRRRANRLRKRGASVTAIARTMDISESSVRAYLA